MQHNILKILFITLVLAIPLSCSDSGPTNVEEDLLKFRITDITIEPNTIAVGDTVQFSASVRGQSNLISEYRWRIVDVTSHISSDPVFIWYANVRPGVYDLEVRPRSSSQVEIESYRMSFEVNE